MQEKITMQCCCSFFHVTLSLKIRDFPFGITSSQERHIRYACYYQVQTAICLGWPLAIGSPEMDLNTAVVHRASDVLLSGSAHHVVLGVWWDNLQGSLWLTSGCVWFSMLHLRSHQHWISLRLLPSKNITLLQSLICAGCSDLCCEFGLFLNSFLHPLALLSSLSNRTAIQCL